MSLILSHPTGNANVKAVAKGFTEANFLEVFYTSLAAFPGNWLYFLGGFAPLRELRKRTFESSLRSKTEIYPWTESGRMLCTKMGWRKLTTHESGRFCVDRVYHDLDRYVAKQLKANKAQAVYAYEDGALHTFRKAKQLGLKCIYDLPIAYWETGRRLLQEEAERLPDWAVTLGGGIKDSQAKLDRKTEELELADVVVGPGSFVMDSLPDWAQTKKRIVSPFGSPGIRPATELTRNESNIDRPLRILFAGSMGQRKGLGDLFEAVKLLNTKQIELVVLGSMLAPESFYREQFANFTYETTRPHHQVLELMRSCDVFCLPSIVEGRALVMQEAMSQGLPLIITPNTGGSDLIEEGQSGFLVPIRSSLCIAEKLNWFIENRQQLPQMRISAQRKAAAYTWEAYGRTIAEELKVYLNATD